MTGAVKAGDPIVYSYLALRKAVGFVALGLPLVLAIPWWFAGHHTIESSISGYYYTGMRNILVGGLCAIGMFMLSCRGYDRWDEIAGIFSAACSLGVALFPTSPDQGATPIQHAVANWHYAFATLLFATLAFFCLFLFKKSSNRKTMTGKKRSRNRVYTACGYVILASMLLIFVLAKLAGITHLVGDVSPMLCFEATALWAFGIAWLVKGETFLRDETPGPPRADAGP